jgi:uncharacterized membrane protein
MEAILFFLLFGLVLVFGPIVLGIVTFVRVRRLHADVERLSARLHRLETRPGEPRTEPAGVRRQAEVPPVILPPKSGSHDVHAPGPIAQPVIPEPAIPEPGIPADVIREPVVVAEHDEESLESRIGGRWLLYIGVIAIVIGVAYFQKLAIDNNWIGETARVIEGVVLGFALIYGGTRFVRAGYATYGQMICGGGVAILYVSTYAAFNLYHLIERPTAFVLMVAITAIAAFLADRQNSQGLAVLAVGGGFATPFMLPGHTDAQVALFTYVAILIGGTVVLAQRHDWALLHLVSYLFTLMTVAGWADRFYRSSKYLVTELFLTLFCAMFLVILSRLRHSARSQDRAAAMFLWTAPLAYYLASLAILANHPKAMLLWFIAVMLAGGFLSVRVGARGGLLVWAAVALPLLAWTRVYNGPAWLWPGLATIGGVYVIALAAQLHNLFTRDDAGESDIAWIHLNGLLMFAAAHFLLEVDHLAVTGTFAASFAVWHGVLAAALLKRRRDVALHFVALGFTLLSIAIALEFDGAAVTIGWACEGAAIVALGLLERRDWLRIGGTALFGVALFQTIALLIAPAPLHHVVALNPRAAAGAVVVALSYLLARLHYRDASAPNRDVAIGAALIVAQVMTLVLFTSEIYAYWAVRDDRFARELMVSVTWGIYATALIIIGLRQDYAPIRYFAIGLLTLTIVKVFFADMAELDRIYRVSSVIGLGVVLLVTSYLYNRARRR